MNNDVEPPHRISLTHVALSWDFLFSERRHSLPPVLFTFHFSAFCFHFAVFCFSCCFPVFLLDYIFYDFVWLLCFIFYTQNKMNIYNCFYTNPLCFSILFYWYLFLWFCDSFWFPWWLDIWFNDGSLSVHLILICCAKCKSHLFCCFALIVLDFWCVVKFLLLIYVKHIHLEGCVRILVWTDSMLCKLICFSLYTTVLPCCVNIPDEHL